MLPPLPLAPPSRGCIHLPQCSPAPSPRVTLTTVVTEDMDDLHVPKHDTPQGDNHCLQLQHRGQDLSTGAQWGSQGQPRAKPSLLALSLGALREGDGISSSGTGDKSLSSWWFLPRGNPMRPDCCSRPTVRAMEIHRTRLRVKLSQGKLLCQWDGDWGHVLCTQPGASYCPLPEGTVAQIMESCNGLGRKET